MRLRFGNCLFDSATREVVRDGQPVSLSPKAFQLLELLIRHRPNALSKQAIQEALWPHTFVAEANLANLIADLRAALGDDARDPRVIRTLQRFGYSFQAIPEPLPDDSATVRALAACRLIWGEREVALREGENFLGRDEESIAWIDVHSVSRHHARIVVMGESATIEDLGSKNGTFVQGIRVTGLVSLHDSDSIRLGTVELVFRRFLESESTATVDTPAV
jgi:DNA-binding winged helix-turn-helix (wHTH) protein